MGPLGPIRAETQAPHTRAKSSASEMKVDSAQRKEKQQEEREEEEGRSL